MHVMRCLAMGRMEGQHTKTSHRGCIMRKAVSREVTAGGRFNFFWTLKPLRTWIMKIFTAVETHDRRRETKN